MAKTQQEYVEHSAHCPFCDSSDIEGHSVDVDGDGASQIVSCNRCGRRWNDLYKLTGYEEIV